MKILRPKLFFASLTLCLILTACGLSEDSQTIAITNVTVIDAEGGLRSGQTVIVHGNRIVRVGNAPDLDMPRGARQLDGNGKFLIPGLWDTHIHLTYEPQMTHAMFDLFLVNGITSVRDTGGELELVIPLKQQADASPTTTPRVMVAGPLLDGVPTVYDGVSRIKLGEGAGTPEEAKALVDRYIDAGVDLIKSYEMLTPEAFAAVIERTKSRGKFVTGHVPLSMDVVDASNQGLRSMEHMRNLEMANSKDHDSLLTVRRELLKNLDGKLGLQLRSSIHTAQRIHAIQTEDAARRDEVLKTLHDNDTWQTPTLSIVTPRAFRPFAQPEWRDKYKYLPDSVADRWMQGSLTMIQQPLDEQDLIFPNWALRMVKHLKEAEVPIMAGTDTPIFFLTPGFSLHNELRLLVQAGLTPMEALASATYLPAKYFEMENELGLIKTGMLADLVLLDANPLEDIANTESIQAVIRDGKLHNRTALNTILYRLDKDNR